MLTRNEIEKALPPSLKSAATQSYTDMVNQAATDPIMAQHIRDNFLSYSKVLNDGKFKTDDYLHAVMYVSYKLMGYSNQDAYFRTFPIRHQHLVAKGTSAKDISAYVSAYHRGKLVGLILEQSLTPVWVLNQDMYQKALNVQADLMENAQSEMVRTTAANSILTQLQKPKDTAQALVKIEVNDNSGMEELKRTLMQVASKQLEAIEGGVTARDIAAIPLVPKVIENDPA